MIRQFSLFAVSGFAMVTVVLSAHNSDQTASPAVMHAVEAAFPQDIRYAENVQSEDAYNTCAAVVDQGADGTPDLIAAAYSGDGAKVAILSNTSSGAEIISDEVHEQFLPTDGPCDLKIVNLAGTEHSDSPLAKAIDVTFSNGPDWFFTWNGKELENITAVRAEMGIWRGRAAPDSAMYSASVVDIDHSGSMQIVADDVARDRFPQEDGILSTGAQKLYRYNGTTYAPVQAILFIAGYTPNLPKTPDQQAKYTYGTPPWAFPIAMHQAPAPHYKLLIVNGDRNESNRVSSAQIEVNGVTIVQPAEVNQGVETLVRTIQLQKQNKIKVTVDGPAESHLDIVIE